MIYVTYDESGTLTGFYQQDLNAAHAADHIELQALPAKNWTCYRANAARDGIEEIVPDEATLLAKAKAAKSQQINEWRAAANATTFPYLGKHIQCDMLSTIDLMGTANAIALTGSFPPGFPGAWKTLENTYIPLPSVDDFKALYEAFTQQGALNFQHAQDLKAAVAAAATEDQLSAIVW